MSHVSCCVSLVSLFTSRVDYPRSHASYQASDPSCLTSCNGCLVPPVLCLLPYQAFHKIDSDISHNPKYFPPVHHSYNPQSNHDCFISPSCACSSRAACLCSASCRQCFCAACFNRLAHPKRLQIRRASRRVELKINLLSDFRSSIIKKNGQWWLMKKTSLKPS